MYHSSSAIFGPRERGVCVCVCVCVCQNERERDREKEVAELKMPKITVLISNFFPLIV